MNPSINNNISGYQNKKITCKSNTKKNNKINLYSDGIDDGKISNKNKLKHFKDGIVSPFKQLFSSQKNFLIGAAAIGAGAVLCTMLPPMLPVMTAIGLVTGALHIGTGVYKASTATKDSQAEQAWEKIGMGTFSFTTSALGAKHSLKSAGIENTKHQGVIKSCIECFRSIPENLSRSFKMLKNKTAFTNLKFAFKKITLNKDAQDIKRLRQAGYEIDKLDEIQLYAEKLHEQALKMTQGEGNCIDELKAILPEKYHNNITYRVKSVSSIRDKMIRKLTRHERVEDLHYAKNLIEQRYGADFITKNNLTPDQIIQSAKKLAPKRKLLIENLDDAKNDIFDLIGVRLVVDKLDDAEVKIIAENLARGMAEGKIEFKFIKNYRGKGVQPYFNVDNLDILTEGASYQKKNEFFYRQGKGMDTKSSGYTTAQLVAEHKNGVLCEFQIRGRQIDKIASAEHLPYDIRLGKDITYGSPLLDTLYKQLTKYTKHLSDSGYDNYNSYLTALYKYYRQLELGEQNLKLPVISDYLRNPASVIKDPFKHSHHQMQKIFSGVLKHLDIQNVEEAYSQSTWLRNIPRSNFVQSLMYSGKHKLVMNNSIENFQTKLKEKV